MLTVTAFAAIFRESDVVWNLRLQARLVVWRILSWRSGRSGVDIAASTTGDGRCGVDGPPCALPTGAAQDMTKSIVDVAKRRLWRRSGTSLMSQQHVVAMSKHAVSFAPPCRITTAFTPTSPTARRSNYSV